MKKVVYLAPIFLLSLLGKEVAASQVEHVNSLDGTVEQMNEAPANTQQNMLGKGVAASQVEHVSSLNGAVEQMNEASANTQQNMLGKGVAASQVEHVSSLNGAVEQTNKASADTQQNMQIKNKQPVYPIELEEKAAMATTITINDPANNKVHVHYIDANGNAVKNSSHDDDYDDDGSYDYDIDVTKTGQGSYDVPDGYSVNNPDGKYNISVKNVGTSIYTDSGLQNYTDVKMPGNAVRELAKAFNITNYSSDADAAAKIKEELDKDNRILFYAYRGVPAEPIATPAFYTVVDHDNDSNWGTMYSKTAKIIIRDARKSSALWNFLKKARLNNQNIDAWSIDFQTKYDHTFSDNSGNVKSVNGNTVNVVLNHKTQHINANGADLGNNASSNVFIIDGNSKKQINTQTRSFKTTGLLDLVTNATQISGNWQATAKPTFDEVTLTAPIGYDSLNSKLLTLTL